MVFLHAHGVSTSRAVRIFKTYGQDAIDVVSENPYRLARDIRGIGFLSADTIAQKIGIAKDSPMRAQAGISYALSEASGQGHCGLPYAELVPLAVKLLDIPGSIIETAIAQEITEEVWFPDTVDGQPCVFLAPLYCAEQSIAAQIERLKTGTTTLPAFDADKAIPWVEQKLSIELADSQKDGDPSRTDVQAAGDHRRPGGRQDDPGQFHSDHPGGQGRQAPRCARRPAVRPSGCRNRRAWKPRPSIACSRSIRPIGQFKRNADNPLDCDLLVADECSMIDVPLANQLLKAVATSTAVILVGDVDQLPSVGPGQFLADLIDSGRGAGHPPDRGVPPGGDVAHRAQCPPDQPGRCSQLARQRARPRTSTSSRSTIPRRSRRRWSIWYRRACPGSSTSTRCATSRCCAR